jgi:hypothetical protein
MPGVLDTVVTLAICGRVFRYDNMSSRMNGRTSS